MKIQEVLESEKKEIERKKDLFFSGLKDVDKAIGGIEPGELMIFSGNPSVGKTAFCLSAAMNSGRKTLFMTGEKFQYLTTRLAGSNGKTWDKFKLIIEKLAALPLYFKNIEGLTIDEPEKAVPSEIEQILEHFAVHEPAEELKDMDPLEMYTRELPPWLLIIDPIDYVYKYYPKQGDDGALRRELLLKYIKGIKRLAKKLNAAVIVTAKALETESGCAELSGEVAECAPLAEFLCLLDWEDREDLTERRLGILKNVHGSRGSVLLNMDREFGILKDYSVDKGGN